MVQVQRSQEDNPHTAIPNEMFLSCATLQARREDIHENMRSLIEDVILGDASQIEARLARISPTKMLELELMAQVVVSKALDEPQHCKACVSLAGALQMLLPALPPCQQGEKGETFMHALLDVFQMEFEAAIEALCRGSEIHLSIPPCATRLAAQRESEAILATERNQHRIRAIVHLGGHLHLQGLLGNGVVSHMVHDLVDNGEAEAANELLWFIGAVATHADQHPHLGTVLEDAGDSDSASSKSIA